VPEGSDHHHCKVCGDVCPPGASFCSSACEGKRAETLRQRRLLQTLMYATILVLAVVFVFNLSHA